MPIPIAAGIAAAASLLGTGGQIYAQAKMNKKTIRYNREMYEKQKADNLANWNLQNSYDSPEAQMGRFKAAGLNPNLIYGQGQQSGAIHTGDIKSADQNTPDIQGGVNAALGSYMSTQMQKEQINNLKKQQDVLTADANLKAAQTLESLQRKSSGAFALSRDQQTLSYDIDAKKQEVLKRIAEQQNLAANTASTTDNNRRAQEMQSGNLRQQVANVAATIAQTAKTNTERNQIIEATKILKQSQEMNAFEIMLNKRGFTKSDPVYYRIANQLMKDVLSGEKINTAIENAKETIKTITNPKLRSDGRVAPWWRK